MWSSLFERSAAVVPVAKRPAVDLSGLARWQGLHEVEYLRHLVAAQVLAILEERTKVVLRERGGASDDECLDPLAEFRIGSADHRAIAHAFVSNERRFDFLGVYLDAARVDDVVRPTVDPKASVGIQMPKVAPPPPTIDELLARQ